MEISFIAVIILAYLIGSIPWGPIFTQFFSSKDIRQAGSGNIGATNVLRTAGLCLGILTLAGDILKGVVPAGIVLISSKADGFWLDVYLAAVMLAAFLGHLYPVYIKFKGGKGVATAIGCFLVTAPLALILVLPFFAGVLFFYRRMSAASLSLAFLLPVFVFWTESSIVLTGCALFVMIFIFLRHRENLKRLACGVEPALWGKENK